MAENIAEIRKFLENLSGDELQKACEKYTGDQRRGVQILIGSVLEKEKKRQAELGRVAQMAEYERNLAGNCIFCGIDEAGRGPLAGPVVAAAVIMPADTAWIPFVNDSKKLTEKKREELFDRIMDTAVSVGVGMADEKVIDQINILQATYQAMRQAVQALSVVPDTLVNDAVRIPGLAQKQIPVIKGDAKCYSVAAASIIAKVTRDRLMREYDRLYPDYGFEENKGYGSAAHIQVLKEKGPCPIHRKTFITHFV